MGAKPRPPEPEDEAESLAAALEARHGGSAPQEILARSIERFGVDAPQAVLITGGDFGGRRAGGKMAGTLGNDRQMAQRPRQGRPVHPRPKGGAAGTVLAVGLQNGVARGGGVVELFVVVSRRSTVCAEVIEGI